MDDDSFSQSSLLCHENDEDFSNAKKDEITDFNSVDFFAMRIDDEKEYIESMIQREKTQFDSKRFVSSSRFDCARLDSINWILNTISIFGFQFYTAYLSVNYFDRFLSNRPLDDGKSWAFRLLSIACLSLAAKMVEYKAPPLSEFPVDDYCFENKSIQRMELLVLTTLEWKLDSVTPFTYLHCLTHKFDSELRTIVYARAVEFIAAMTKEINLIDHRPSVIAVAAIFAASDDALTLKSFEQKMKVFSFLHYLEYEDVFSCYKLMQEIEMRKFKTPVSVLSPNVLSSSTNANNNELKGRAGVKRRLAFTISDQSCPVKKTHRNNG